jgi:NAD(P)-dependent dehydrogenase (short-subunit alcohol dehydrogenase family)
VGATVVVGGARNIGEAVCRRLATEAWAGPLVIADLDIDLAQGLARELTTGDVDITARHVDIADPGSIEALAAAEPDTERLALVAGVHVAAPSLDTSWGEFERVVRINLMGSFFVAQAFARRMVERGSGAIVAVSSISGRLPRLGQAAYGASKAGMTHALRSLALDTVPRGVRINLVSPGATDTAMARGVAESLGQSIADLPAGDLDRFRPRVPDGAVAAPSQIASAVAYLLSPESAHIAFHELVVDGGESLGL